MSVEQKQKVSLKKMIEYGKFFAALFLLYLGFQFWQKWDMVIIPIDNRQMIPSFREKAFHAGVRGASWWNYKYGDVVYYNYPAKPDKSRREMLFFARIVGFPGDRIGLQNGKLYRNGLAVEERYLDEGNLGKENLPETIVPRDYCYLLLDHRNTPFKEVYYRDSRFLGPILVHTFEGQLRAKGQ